MPRPVSIRLSQREREELAAQAAAEGKSLSKVIRERVFGAQQDDERLDAIERRLSRLEEMAGL